MDDPFYVLDDPQYAYVHEYIEYTSYVLDILNKPLNSKSQNKANAHARERDERE